MELRKWIFMGLIGLSALSIIGLLIPGFYFPFFFLFIPPLMFSNLGSDKEKRTNPHSNYLGEKNNITNYCDNCGLKITKQWNYCPNCSNPLELDTSQFR